MKCVFNKTIEDLELKLLNCKNGYETSIRYKNRIDEAEGILEDLVDLVKDRDYKPETKDWGKWPI